MSFNYYLKSIALAGFMSLLSIVSLYGQDYALEFDGIDDSLK